MHTAARWTHTHRGVSLSWAGGEAAEMLGCGAGGVSPPQACGFTCGQVERLIQTPQALLLEGRPPRSLQLTLDLGGASWASPPVRPHLLLCVHDFKGTPNDNASPRAHLSCVGSLCYPLWLKESGRARHPEEDEDTAGKVKMEAMMRPLLPPRLSEPQPTAASPEPTDEPRPVPEPELLLGPEVSWKEARSSLQSM